MPMITIVDESTLGAQNVWSIDIPDETISLRELLRRRIFQEVSAYNEKQLAYFNEVVQPDDTEHTLNGARLKTARKLDWEAQYKKAIEAFSRRSFIVLVDKCQLDQLDTTIALQAHTEVRFFKLIPLVGG